MKYETIKSLLREGQHYEVDGNDVMVRADPPRRVGAITPVNDIRVPLSGERCPKNQVDIIYTDFTLEELYSDQLELLEHCEAQGIPYREVLDLSERIHGDKRDIKDMLVFQATRALKLAERVEDMNEI